MNALKVQLFTSWPGWTQRRNGDSISRKISSVQVYKSVLSCKDPWDFENSKKKTGKNFTVAREKTMLLICASEVQKHRRISKNLATRKTTQMLVTAESTPPWTMTSEDHHLSSQQQLSEVHQRSSLPMANSSKSTNGWSMSTVKRYNQSAPNNRQNSADPDKSEQRKVRINKSNKKKQAKLRVEMISSRPSSTGKLGECVVFYVLCDDFTNLSDHRIKCWDGKTTRILILRLHHGHSMPSNEGILAIEKLKQEPRSHFRLAKPKHKCSVIRGLDFSKASMSQQQKLYDWPSNTDDETSWMPHEIPQTQTSLMMASVHVWCGDGCTKTLKKFIQNLPPPTWLL